MLTLVSPIPKISLSRNPIPMRLRATNAFGQPYRAFGASAVLLCTVDNLEIDDTISITWVTQTGNSQNVLFTTYEGAAPEVRLPYAFIECAAVIAAHPMIAPHFHVILNTPANGENTITIEAKDPTFNYLLEIQAAITFENPDFVVVNSFVNTLTSEPDAYNVTANVYFETTFQAGDWQLVSESVLYLDENGDLPVLDLSSILARECDRTVTENPFTHYSRTIPTLADNIRRYYIEYKEQYTNAVTPLNTSPIFLVMNGGVPNRIFLQNGYNFFDDLNKTSVWLSYQPQRTRLIPTQTAFISWFNNAPTTQRVKLRIKITDNRGNAYEIFSSAVSAPSYRALTFPISLVALGLNAATYEARYIRVTVLSDDAATLDTPLSIERHFIFDYAYSRSVRCLGYLNAFGLPETVHCTGDLTKSVEIQRSNYIGSRFDSLGRTAQVQRQTRGNYRVNWTYRVGSLTAAVSEQLAELEISRVLSDLTDGRDIALAFKDNKFTASAITDSGETIYERQITAVPRIALNNFAPDSLFEGIVEIENVQEIVTGDTTNYTPPTGGTPQAGVHDEYHDEYHEGGSAAVAPTPTLDLNNVVELGTVGDTDRILFYRTDANGAFIGFGILPAGKMMRTTRGISNTASSHLNGINSISENGQEWVGTVDNQGNFNQSPK